MKQDSIVGRPREFDEDEVLDAAMNVFWKKGFAETSFSDLTRAMGLSRSSIYRAFGEKDELFVASLRRYDEVVMANLLLEMTSLGGIGGVARFFDLLVSHLNSSKGRFGCFITNSTAELAASAPRVRRSTASSLGRLEGAFVAALRNERISGRQVARLSRHLTVVTQGLHLIAKSRPSRETLRDAADVALSAVRASIG